MNDKPMDDKDDKNTLDATTSMTRRTFTAGATAAGFALAAGPVSAAAIKTPTLGLEAKMVDIPVGGPDSDETIPGYMAMPWEGAGFNPIIVIHEIFGVHEYVRDVCRRLAHAGFAAIAPDLFHRQGDPTGMDDIQKIIDTIVSKVPDEQVMSDLDDTVRYFKNKPRVRHSGKLGVTGFCWGGRQTWLYAAHNDDIDAAVAWYGRLTGEKTDNTPKHPIDIAPELKAPVLGLYGGQDDHIPMADINAMEKALTDSSRYFKMRTYPPVGHAFHADYRPTYDAYAAKAGWAECLEWFRKFDF